MARKGWSELSPTYRGRLERAGVTESAYERGASIKGARGHALTPEHPPRYVGTRFREPGNPAVYRTGKDPRQMKAAVRKVAARPEKDVALAIKGKLSKDKASWNTVLIPEDVLLDAIDRHTDAAGELDSVAFANQVLGIESFGGPLYDRVDGFHFSEGMGEEE